MSVLSRLTRYVAFGLIITGLSISLLGCGSGGGAGTSARTVTFCSADEFTPNCTGAILLDQWTHMPVRVYFTNDATFTDASGQVDLKTFVLAGMNEWVDAANGLVGYQVVSSPAEADITFTFTTLSAEPSGDAELGLAKLTYAPNMMMDSVAVQLYIWDGMTHNRVYTGLQATAAHEFGHVLGIHGHSTDANDLMYAYHDSEAPAAVTQSDLNTVKTIYACAGTRKVAGMAPASRGFH
jgi:predicted Zn-dependent protease